MALSIMNYDFPMHTGCQVQWWDCRKLWNCEEIWKKGKWLWIFSILDNNCFLCYCFCMHHFGDPSGYRDTGNWNTCRTGSGSWFEEKTIDRWRLLCLRICLCISNFADWASNFNIIPGVVMYFYYIHFVAIYVVWLWCEDAQFWICTYSVHILCTYSVHILCLYIKKEIPQHYWFYVQYVLPIWGWWGNDMIETSVCRYNVAKVDTRLLLLTLMQWNSELSYERESWRQDVAWVHVW